jgi:hypothetical protein
MIQPRKEPREHPKEILMNLTTPSDKEPKVFDLGTLPEGNRLLKYCQELKEIIENNKDAFSTFLKKIYADCMSFLCNNQYVPCFPRIDLFFVPTHQEYLTLEKKTSEGAIQKEVGVRQSYGFSVVTIFGCQIYIDAELHIDLLKHGGTTFVLGLVETYIHELLHCAFSEKLSEQKIYELQCVAVEDFLDIKLPLEHKNRKAADYYRSK